MECSHRRNGAILGSSSGLGKSKDWLKMSTEAFLNMALVQHNVSMRQDPVIRCSVACSTHFHFDIVGIGIGIVVVVSSSSTTVLPIVQ